MTYTLPTILFACPWRPKSIASGWLALLVCIIGPTLCGAEGDYDTTTPLTELQIQQAKSAYDHAIELAGKSKKAKQLAEQIGTLEALARDCENTIARGELPHYSPSSPPRRFGGGLGDIAYEAGQQAMLAKTKRDLEQHRKSLKRIRQSLDEHLKKTAWHNLSEDDRRLCIIALPQANLEKTTSDPSETHVIRQNSADGWVEVSVDNEVTAWFPIEPYTFEIEKLRGSGLEATDPKTGIRYSVFSVPSEDKSLGSFINRLGGQGVDRATVVGMMGSVIVFDDPSLKPIGKAIDSTMFGENTKDIHYFALDASPALKGVFRAFAIDETAYILDVRGPDDGTFMQTAQSFFELRVRKKN